MIPDNSVPNNRVMASKKSFAILDQLKDSDGMGVTEIAEEVSIAKSTVHNHLQTMEEIGYVVQNSDGYHVGLRFLELGVQARERHGLYQAAKPEVDALVEDVGERAQLMVEENNVGIYVYQARSNRSVNTDSHIGARVNLHTTSVGKAYLAFLPDEERDAIINRIEFNEMTPNTIVDRDELEQELEKTRERGYALNNEERIMGMRAVGAPILSEEGQVLGSVSVSGPTTRMKGDRFREVVPETVVQTARVIGVRSTFS